MVMCEVFIHSGKASIMLNSGKMRIGWSLLRTLMCILGVVTAGVAVSSQGVFDISRQGFWDTTYTGLFKDQMSHLSLLKYYTSR